EAACFVARRHPNVFLDLSGIPPHRLLHHVPQLPRLWDKCLWGTDWPGPGLPADAVRTNVEAFLAADLGLTRDQKAAVLDGNSRRFFP
ncbi:MAG: amidohydrolase, partial [Euryarchaeota archaeon]|nr:amidohydrolase [Euryarchaeota archaeon]